jgi:hypothetical protein
MGGHLVHLVHFLLHETEKGGPFAAVGIVLGLIIGYASNSPVMHPSEPCQRFGIGRDVIGQCPNVLDAERLLHVLFVGAVFGLAAIVVGYLAVGDKSAE